MFKMFTSTRKEKICKGQKRYYLLPYDPNKPNIYTYAPTAMKEAKKELSKKQAKVLRKTNIDMERFG